jgi:hypothetical protein
MTSTNEEREGRKALEQRADALLRKHGNNLAWQRGPGCDTWDAAIRAIVEALASLPAPAPAGEVLADSALAAAARNALGTWLSWPDAPRDGPRPVTNEQTESWLHGLPNKLAGVPQAPATGGDAVLATKLRELQDARQNFVTARQRMNEARPPISATRAERALYDERYTADDKAQRELHRVQSEFAMWAAEVDAAALANHSPDAGGDWLPIDTRPMDDSMFIVGGWFGEADIRDGHPYDQIGWAEEPQWLEFLTHNENKKGPHLSRGWNHRNGPTPNSHQVTHWRPCAPPACPSDFFAALNPADAEAGRATRLA